MGGDIAGRARASSGGGTVTAEDVLFARVPQGRSRIARRLQALAGIDVPGRTGFPRGNGTGDGGHGHVQGASHRQDRDRAGRRGGAVRRRRPHDGRRHGAGDPFDRQLQGRARHHGPLAGGAAVPHDPGRRLRGHGRDVVASGGQTGRCRGAERLGRRRDPSRRLCGARPRQGRLARAAAAGVQPGRRHGDRHCRLHRHAGRAGDREAGARAERRPRARHGGGRRGRIGRGGAAEPARVARHRLDGGGPRKRGSCWGSGPPRSSGATSCRSPVGRSARSAGPRRSTPSARTRWPTSCPRRR